MDIVTNLIGSCAVGINAGGSIRGLIGNNKLLKNDRAITIFQVETDGAGANFGIACVDITIEGNAIDLDQGQGGIYLIDGPEQVRINGNRFTSQFSTVLSDLCWAHTDAVVIKENQWNGSPIASVGGQTVGEFTQVTVPDVLDVVSISPATSRIDMIVGLHSAMVADRVMFLRVTNGGAWLWQGRGQDYWIRQRSDCSSVYQRRCDHWDRDARSGLRLRSGQHERT